MAVKSVGFGYICNNSGLCFCGRVPWLYQYWPGGFMLFVVLCPGTPEGSTGSGSGFKASQKTGQRLKVWFIDFIAWHYITPRQNLLFILAQNLLYKGI